MSKTDLNTFNNAWFKVGKPKLIVLIWYIVNASIFRSYLLPISGIKRIILRLFGAKVGRGVVIKPQVNIKYPWKLEIGENTWIGEDVWIDNLDQVTIGANVCISQGALLLSGNHDYRASSFDLIIKPIVLEEGVWIGAKSMVTQGVVCRSHSILSVNSVASKDLEANTIYRGNPAMEVKTRTIG